MNRQCSNGYSWKPLFASLSMSGAAAPTTPAGRIPSHLWVLQQQTSIGQKTSQLRATPSTSWWCTWCPLAAPAYARVWVLVCPMHFSTLRCTWTTWAPCLYGLWAYYEGFHLRGWWRSLARAWMMSMECNPWVVDCQTDTGITWHYLALAYSDFDFRTWSEDDYYGHSVAFWLKPRLLKAGWSRKVGKRSLVWTSSFISRCSVITEVFVFWKEGFLWPGSWAEREPRSGLLCVLLLCYLTL